MQGLRGKGVPTPLQLQRFDGSVGFPYWRVIRRIPVAEVIVAITMDSSTIRTDSGGVRRGIKLLGPQTVKHGLGLCDQFRGRVHTRVVQGVSPSPITLPAHRLDSDGAAVVSVVPHVCSAFLAVRTAYQDGDEPRDQPVVGMNCHQTLGAFL